MASFEKRGKKWCAIVSAIEGVKRSKTFDTKREATDWAVKVESSKIDGYNIAQSKIPF